MTAQSDPELFPWLQGASKLAGDFLKHLSEAGLRADAWNYPILRPALLRFKEKYPHYHEEELQKMIRDGYKKEQG